MERLLGTATIFQAIDLRFELTNASLEGGIEGGKVLLMLGSLSSKALLHRVLAHAGLLVKDALDLLVRGGQLLVRSIFDSLHVQSNDLKFFTGDLILRTYSRLLTAPLKGIDPLHQVLDGDRGCLGLQDHPLEGLEAVH
jgi:hypothetical protein